MAGTTELLANIFAELSDRISALNETRRKNGLFAFPRAEVLLLGQMSLLADSNISLMLTLAQTSDLDALLTMDHAIKQELQVILESRGLLYDEDSPLIWIPPGSTFNSIFDLMHVTVRAIDPESALVSKAIKAPAKNLQLIREAFASDKFPTLVPRILAHGGRLEDFA